MTEYDMYTKSINQIFEYLEWMKQKWNNQDNLNYIEEIEKYKDAIIESSKLVEEKHNKIPEEMEALGE